MFKVSLTNHSNSLHELVVMHIGHTQSTGYERYDMLVVSLCFGSGFVLCVTD